MRVEITIKEYRNKGKEVLLHGPFHDLNELWDYIQQWISPRKYELRINKVSR